VELKKDGFTAFGQEVELRDGGHRVLVARLVSRVPPPGKVPPRVPPRGQPESKVGIPPPESVADAGPGGERPAVAKAPAPPTTQPAVAPKGSPARQDVEPPQAPAGGIAVTKKRPPPAEAPFHAARAKELKRAWATYPGRQVEEEVDLGGGVTMPFVLIPPGAFTMGSPEAERDQVLREDKTARREYFADEARHPVTVTKPFYLGRYAVTRGQFRRFVSEADYRTEAETGGLGGWGYDRASGKFKGPTWNPKTGKRTGGARTAFSWKDPGFAQTDRHPVVNVSWNDARAFCRWLARRGGRKARLPSEAEWEHACRAGTATRYYFGDDPEELAEYANVLDGTFHRHFPGARGAIKAEDGYVFTAPVGSFRPNPFGLFDMHGNVLQWCTDWYEPDLAGLAPRDPLRLDKVSHSARVVRGGSWLSQAAACRTAFREMVPPASCHCTAGFRVGFRLD
jgi:formylglycine-generating enzyme required for sulfatase activity